MINGAHVILYSTDAEADRVFIRDMFGFAGVDAGDGWLIFKLPPAEIAVHPTDGFGKHEFYLMCDDLEKTLADLTAKGVTISQPPSDTGWGRLCCKNSRRAYGARGSPFLLGLGRHSKEAGDEGHLPGDVAFAHPSDLSLANHVHDLVSL